ncbi:CRISPR-associated protein Cas8c/Csd1%2C subtype I-C/DVULG [uncultured Blautia sp.]|nr:type I-C CRISPR-associated protein Cas8c/Csd1 [uncultured Blautia sp.]SCI09981.1 CRISPR-associated protein Cas8c/Csd1%2C subtype I-C/DVULG [uncultured Blautia sp.]
MILQALVKYYEDLEKQGKLPRQGWCQAKVSYGINLSTDGNIKNIIWLKDEIQAGKKQIWTSKTMSVPAMLTRSSGIAANFLCDNSKYLLGIDKSGTGKRIVECFEAAKKKHLKLLGNASGEMAQAICAFFRNWDPEEAKKNIVVLENWEEITDGGNLIFCMNEGYAQDDDEIQKIWDAENEQTETDAEGICLVTGERTEISRIHRNIKGVPGAQSSGAALVSFNAPSFESYGKEQSYNAPVGKYAEFAYTSALNYLLAQRKYTFPLGDSMIVYWAEEAKLEYQDVLLALLNPVKDNQNEVHAFFEKLRKDEQIMINDMELNPSQKFYILCLAPNAARLSVRFFYQSSFGNITKNLACHYERMQMIKPKWEEREYLGIEDMLKETVNMNSRDKKPISNMAAMVFSAILQNSRYPASLYTDALIRIRAEQGCVTWGRASIVKAFLMKNHKNTEGEICMGLNEESNDVAYVLGRLFSVLESIQTDANPGIKSTIRDRYFNSACATPASVFPVLFKLKNSHIKKLEREKESAKVYYEKLLTQIVGKLEMYPKRLSLEEQGRFILGYYHQMQKKYEKREEK